MKQSNQHFIKCSDAETISKLKTLGYQLMEETGGIATFINDTKKPHTFSESKVAYTNILAMSTL